MSESCTDAVCPDVWGHVGARSGEKGVFVQAEKHYVRYVHCVSFTVWQLYACQDSVISLLVMYTVKNNILLIFFLVKIDSYGCT